MAAIRSRRTHAALLVSIVMLIASGGVAVASHAFTDVPDDAYYHEATAFMKDTGITQGCTATEYCPGNALTRGQMAQFLWRVAGVGDVAPMVNATSLDGLDSADLQTGADWVFVEADSVDFRTPTPVVLGTVDIVAPSDGVAVVRFDGSARTDLGDNLTLAASDVPDWSINSGNITVEAISAQNDRVPFVHSRAYAVGAGPHTFYAVAQNWTEQGGDGTGTVYGTLTVEFFPERL